MERRFSVRSTSRQTAEIREELVASVREDPDGSIVRRLVLGSCVANPKNPDAALAIAIRHQRRAHLADEWREPEFYGPAQLKAGQELRLDFDTGETLQLYRRLAEWYAVCSGGVEVGERILSVVDENEATVLRGHERELLEQMLQSGDDFWTLIESLQPDLFTAAAVARIHQERVRAVDEFDYHMAVQDWAESDWQGFFEAETWIFGHGLAYQFLDVVTGQPAYGGTGVNRRGLQLGDYLMATRATARFTVLVEIKRPDADLLRGEYRGEEVYDVGRDVAGGVAQVQNACRTWVTEGSTAEANREVLAGIETFEPRGILVIGDTAQLTALPMRRSFELFRRNLTNPEIITFDELLARAKYMVQPDATD